MFKAILLLQVALLAIGVGCTPATPAAPTGPLTQTVDGVAFTITLNPSPPQSGRETAVEVTVADAAGQPVTDGRMILSMESGGHAMTPNVTAAEPKGAGVYAATLKPTGMTGQHSVVLNMQWKDKAYRAKFDGIGIR
jgi:hypothetical protein